MGRGTAIGRRPVSATGAQQRDPSHWVTDTSTINDMNGAACHETPTHQPGDDEGEHLARRPTVEAADRSPNHGPTAGL